ncbi:MAG: hypothetical protein ACI4JS_03255 [Oscillospiraceae bacterium]
MKLKFRNSYHRKTFTGFISENVKNPYYSRSEYVAAVFLLSAEKFLWRCSQSALTGHSVDFGNIDLTGISTDGYALFKAAKSVYNGSADISLNELCDIDLIREETFHTIFSGVLLLRNGIGLLNWRA